MYRRDTTERRIENALEVQGFQVRCRLDEVDVSKGRVKIYLDPIGSTSADRVREKMDEIAQALGIPAQTHIAEGRVVVTVGINP